MSDVIVCSEITKTFHDNGLIVEVLKQINLTVTQGEMLAIVGASGSGKSTLLHLLGGLDCPTQGSLHIADHNLAELNEKQKSRLRNRYLGFIYQFHHLLPEFSALENVMMPLLIRGLKSKQAVSKATAIIEHVGLVDRRQHRIAQLSGGERQRIAIARALVAQPYCVLADEPTGNLDHTTAHRTLDLMCQLNQTMQTSFVIVTHDHTLAAKLHRTLLLKDGILSEPT